MPINPVKRSIKAQAVAEQVFRKAIPQVGKSVVSRFDPGQIEMIPIYSISARNLVAGRWNRGWRSGWRYIWTHRELAEGITVEVRRDERNAAHLASVSIGRSAPALSKELAKVTKRMRNDKNRYRPRILRLPWISMEAIWLNTDELEIPDCFINRGGGPQGDKFRAEAERRAQCFLEAIKWAEKN
ncbi:MAG: hypothetical protein RLZZ157_61 [Pseudomonadota bacterium]|jgi:hypothetical protein